jgi:hypothetical protein
MRRRQQSGVVSPGVGRKRIQSLQWPQPLLHLHNLASLQVRQQGLNTAKATAWGVPINRSSSRRQRLSKCMWNRPRTHSRTRRGLLLMQSPHRVTRSRLQAVRGRILRFQASTADMGTMSSIRQQSRQQKQVTMVMLVQKKEKTRQLNGMHNHGRAQVLTQQVPHQLQHRGHQQRSTSVVHSHHLNP